MVPEAVERGRAVFMASCSACHGLKYLKENGQKEGIKPALDPEAAKASFGVEPPDLSLMAISRGRGLEGADYIYRLLTTYYQDENSVIKNRAFAEETESDGVIAMPPPIPMDDPELIKKSKDVAAFLLKAAEPSAGERIRTGKYVIGFMAVFTTLLFLLNKYTWLEVKKKG